MKKLLPLVLLLCIGLIFVLKESTRAQLNEEPRIPPFVSTTDLYGPCAPNGLIGINTTNGNNFICNNTWSLFNNNLVGGIIGLVDTYITGDTTGNAPWFYNSSSSYYHSISPFSYYLTNLTAVVNSLPSSPVINSTMIAVAKSVYTGTPVYGPNFLIPPGNISAGIAFQAPHTILSNLIEQYHPNWIYIAAPPGGSAYYNISSVTAQISGTTSAILGNYLGVTVTTGSTVCTSFSTLVNALNLCDAASHASNEKLVSVPIPYTNGGTIRNLVTYMETNNGTGAGDTLSFTLDKALAANLTSFSPTNISFTVPTGSSYAPSYGDVSDTASVAQGDVITVKLVNGNSGAASGRVGSLQAELVPTGYAVSPFVFSFYNVALPAGSAIYSSAFASYQNTNYTDLAAGMPSPIVAVNLVCYVTTAPTGQNAVMTLYKNGSPTNISVTIPTGMSVPGEVTDYYASTAHSVNFNALDTFALYYSQASSGSPTAPVLSACSLEGASQAE